MSEHGTSLVIGRPPIEEESAVALRAQLEAARGRIAALEAQLAVQARARAELVHLVSHELRTPITVISGFARLLENEAHGSLNDAQARFVAESLRACTRLDDFVGDLLEARADADTPFRVDPAPADLHEAIEAPLESLVPMLEERGMKVEAQLHARDAVIAIDARRIEQVVTNLLTNAIRYGRMAGVIRIATRDLGQLDATGTPRIEVSVEDDGPGIPEADRERLFAPFVRGAASDDRGGLGIGLAICRRIIEAHAGEIRVESGELGGARFVFELPRAAHGVRSDVDQPRAQRAGGED